mmetsp:Transcript_30848/g.67369  ORF Transcript_30848/g.67369 Transcript_30848/m.67369 type:complete len:310 (-) Transcript_30848:1232-2161(-)
MTVIACWMVACFRLPALASAIPCWASLPGMTAVTVERGWNLLGCTSCLLLVRLANCWDLTSELRWPGDPFGAAPCAKAASWRKGKASMQGSGARGRCKGTGIGSEKAPGPMRARTLAKRLETPQLAVEGGVGSSSTEPAPGAGGSSAGKVASAAASGGNSSAGDAGTASFCADPSAPVTSFFTEFFFTAPRFGSADPRLMLSADPRLPLSLRSCESSRMAIVDERFDSFDEFRGVGVSLLSEPAEPGGVGNAPTGYRLPPPPPPGKRPGKKAPCTASSVAASSSALVVSFGAVLGLPSTWRVWLFCKLM